MRRPRHTHTSVFPSFRSPGIKVVSWVNQILVLIRPFHCFWTVLEHNAYQALQYSSKSTDIGSGWMPVWGPAVRGEARC